MLQSERRGLQNPGPCMTNCQPPLPLECSGIPEELTVTVTTCVGEFAVQVIKNHPDGTPGSWYGMTPINPALCPSTTYGWHLYAIVSCSENGMLVSGGYYFFGSYGGEIGFATDYMPLGNSPLDTETSDVWMPGIAFNDCPEMVNCGTVAWGGTAVATIHITV
jgi:hypothetical protein